MHDLGGRGSFPGLLLVSGLATACGSSTDDSAPGGQDAASCHTLPCVRVFIYSGGAVPKSEHMPILGAIACSPFELDVQARMGRPATFIFEDNSPISVRHRMPKAGAASVGTHEWY